MLIFLTTPGVAPQLVVLDASNRALTDIVTWDAIKDGGLDGTGTDNLMHSIGVSDDGRTRTSRTSKAGSCSPTCRR